jgi:transcriptional regulator with XRE-family HTH domain
MSKLPNYLRTYRKKAGLSQRDVAVLLGSSDPTRISRYELNKREPDVGVVLAFEIIFSVPASVLFAGRLVELKAVIRKRFAQLLPEKTRRLAKYTAVVRGGDNDPSHSRGE